MAANTSKAMKSSYLERVRGLSDNDLAALLAVQSDAFLRSNEWLAIRDKTFVRYGRVCMKCKTNAGINACVDHIKPRRFYPELALDPENLQILCRTCNKRKGNKHATDYR